MEGLHTTEPPWELLPAPWAREQCLNLTNNSLPTLESTWKQLLLQRACEQPGAPSTPLPFRLRQSLGFEGPTDTISQLPSAPLRAGTAFLSPSHDQSCKRRHTGPPGACRLAGPQPSEPTPGAGPRRPAPLRDWQARTCFSAPRWPARSGCCSRGWQCAPSWSVSGPRFSPSLCWWCGCQWASQPAGWWCTACPLWWKTAWCAEDKGAHRTLC